MNNFPWNERLALLYFFSQLNRAHGLHLFVAAFPSSFTKFYWANKKPGELFKGKIHTRLLKDQWLHWT